MCFYLNFTWDVGQRIDGSSCSPQNFSPHSVRTIFVGPVLRLSDVATQIKRVITADLISTGG